MSMSLSRILIRGLQVQCYGRADEMHGSSIHIIQHEGQRLGVVFFNEIANSLASTLNSVSLGLSLPFTASIITSAQIFA